MEKLKNKITSLEAELQEKNNRIKQLEKINEMYLIVEELSRKEEIDYDKTIKAHEANRVLSEREKKSAFDIINAQEKIGALSMSEQKNSTEIISAHNNLKVLSLQELKQRDKILATILRVNKQINNLQPEDSLLEITLTEVMNVLEADKGLILIKDGNKNKIRVKNGFAKNTTLPTLLKKIEAGQKLQQGDPHAVASSLNKSVVTQLKKEGKETGIIFLEKNNSGFRRIDKEFLDIIGSQVSTALNNSHLFMEAKLRNTELKKAIMMNKSLIDHLSYDFKKPLKKLSKTLQKNIDADKTIEPQLKEAIRIANWIINATDRILSFSSLEEEVNEMFNQHISIEKIIRGIIDKLKTKINEKKIKIKIKTIDSIIDIEGNKSIFQVIFDELITNAVVYNKDGGEINILINQEKDKIIVFISDTGLGVKKKNTDKIFERFYREPTSYENYKKGAGLGLFIVKKFIENYSGTIEFKSRFDHGSEVKITLPV